MITVGITGSIGSGKSVVCKLFAMLGIPVYDSDSRAKSLMNSDPQLAESLMQRFGKECFRDGTLDRKFLADRVFGDSGALADLNALVHPAVTRDFTNWAQAADSRYVIVESAIMYESGLDRVVDYVVAVTAPMQVRIRRAVLRDNSSEKNIRNRMQHQMDDEALTAAADFVIVNDDKTLLWPQVLKLDSIFSRSVCTASNTAETVSPNI